MKSHLKNNQPSKKTYFDIQPTSNQKKQKREKRYSKYVFWVILSALFIIINVTLFIHQLNRTQQTFEHISQKSLESSQKGIQLLLSGQFELAKKHLHEAEKYFNDIQSKIKPTIITEPKRGSYLSSAYQFTEIAKRSVQISLQISELLETLSLLKENPQFLGNKKSFNLKSTFLKYQVLKNSIAELKAQSLQLEKDYLPLEIKQKWEIIEGYLDEGLEIIYVHDSYLQALSDFFGLEKPHRILVLFQNPNEKRATGGFIGSYAIIDLNDGLLSKIEIKDVYESDGQLLEKITPPPGINQVANRYYMRDANYSPDFPTSARKIKEFLEKSRGPSVDTIIAINPSVAKVLIEAIGPIALKNLPISIDSKNLVSLISFYAEAKVSDTQNSKQILADITPVIIDKISEIKSLNDEIKSIMRLIEQKDIQMFSFISSIQAFSEKLNADGSFIKPKANTDFLSLISTSISGNKSDAFIKTHLTKHTNIRQTGEIINTLTIQKKHLWNEDHFEPWKKYARIFNTKVNLDTLRFIHGAGKNKDYLRIYVPLNSEMIRSEGIDEKDITINKELGFTTLAFNMETDVSEDKSITITYRLPFKLKSTDRYQFIAQKQSGSHSTTFQKTLRIPKDSYFTDIYPKNNLSAGKSRLEILKPFDNNLILITDYLEK